MGFFSDLFGTSEVKPEPGTPVKTRDQVIANLLGINRDTAPFQIRNGAAEGCDLVAEWKIVDAKWYEIFAKAGLKKTFQVLLKFDETTQTVTSSDKEFSVEWEAGIPRIAVKAEFFRGQKTEFSFGAAIGFTEELKPGVIYNYKFNTNELKDPIKQTVVASGWSYKPVVFN